MEQDLESLKWHPWNKNVDLALQLVHGLTTMLAGAGLSWERQKLLQTIRDFGNYIAANHSFIHDYGNRHRDSGRIRVILQI